MTPDDLVTTIKGRMLNNTDASLDALIIKEANIVQKYLGQGDFLPWFLFVDTLPANILLKSVATSEFADIPCDFIRLAEEFSKVMFVQEPESGNWLPMDQDDYSLLQTKYMATGIPRHFDMLGTTLYLRNVPDQVYNLRMLYYKEDEAIEAGSSENLWMQFASDWILAEVGIIMSTQYVSLPKISEIFIKQAIRAKARVSTDTIARKEAGTMRMMGEN